MSQSKTLIITSATVSAADVKENGVTFYTVEVSFKDVEENAIIHRRYSEFRKLYSHLKATYPKLKGSFPKFPPKLLNTTPKDIEFRWEKFDQFIRYVAQHKLLSRDEAFLQFVFG